jgi:hypothetical protein
MAAERRELEPSHELRLEGIGLIVGGGLLLAAVVGAFFLGRWVERQAHPPPPLAAGGAGPLAQVVPAEPAADASDDLTFFDHLEGEQKEAEPGREMPAADATASSPPSPLRPVEPEPGPSPSGSDEDPFYVQVIALRDQRAAAGMIDTLKGQGYRVRLFTEREGGGTLYKVRVGGYRAEDEARAAALKLRESGYPGAFVRTAN